jgi:hypothetical protein
MSLQLMSTCCMSSRSRDPSQETRKQGFGPQRLMKLPTSRISVVGVFVVVSGKRQRMVPKQK